MAVLQMIGVVAVLLAIAFIGLGIKILIQKDGKFPEHRVGHNKEMRRRRIHCVKTQDKAERKKYFKKLKEEAQKKRQLLLENYSDHEEIDSNFEGLTVILPKK